MKKIGMFGVALAAVLATTQVASAKEVNAWTMDFDGGTTVPVGKAGDLKNTQSDKCLVRRTGTVGLGRMGQTDWGLTACGGKHAKILRKDASKTGPLVCGEVFALQLGDKCYRKCTNPQQAGINICADPCGRELHYQWQFRGCAKRQPVNPNTPVTLWNTVRKDSLVHGWRPGSVVDICWADKELGGKCTTARDQ